MTNYLVIMHRFGDANLHTYPSKISKSLEEAIKYLKEEEEARGGKYAGRILKVADESDDYSVAYTSDLFDKFHNEKLKRVGEYADDLEFLTFQLEHISKLKNAINTISSDGSDDSPEMESKSPKKFRSSISQKLSVILNNEMARIKAEKKITSFKFRGD
jgi:hypothetical protein